MKHGAQELQERPDAQEVLQREQCAQGPNVLLQEQEQSYEMIHDPFLELIVV